MDWISRATSAAAMSPKINPKIVHFTEGGPWLEGYGSIPFAAEWRGERNRWAA